MTTAQAIVPERLPAFVLAATLAAAGAIHCFLTPEHMAMSAVFGVGFLAAGIAQFGMAALAVARPSRLLYAAVIASTVLLSSAYAYNVLVGLPFHEVAPGAAAAERGAGGDMHGKNEGHGHAGGHVDAGHEEEAAVTTDHHDDGVALGAGEPVDAYGAVTQLAQLSAAGVALVLLRRASQTADLARPGRPE